MHRSSWLSVETTAEAPIDAPDYCDTPMNNQERRVFAPGPANGTEARNGVVTPATNGRHAPRNGRSSESLRPTPPVETFRLDIPHHSPCACPLCGEPMQEITVTRERWSQNLIVRAENVAAYRCEADDFEQSDLSAHIAFLSGALERIAPTADSQGAEALRFELNAARTIEEKIQSAASAA